MDFYFTVASSSMAPTLNTGDKITVENAEADHIHAGQVIVFKGISANMIVHRVIKRNGFIIITAGDSNRKYDEPVHIFDVIGIVKEAVEKDPPSAFFRICRAIKRKICNTL
ncbi:MAG TPA: signal peptidase I [bacterium]|nr:signal peptidase I [bacterium]HPS30246.1 signal peptidase I [bacterium]